MLQRAACLVTMLLCTTAWPCSPATLDPFNAKGSTARKLTLEVNDRGSVLKQGLEVVWKLPLSAFSVLFAPDDSWVAFSPELGSTKLTIVTTRPNAPPIEIELVSRLSQDERSFLTHSSCGLMWFSSWKATEKGLQVVVTQNGQARPTQEPAAGITFLIRSDGSVTRETAKLEIDLLKLAEQWKGPASTARADALQSIARLSSTETGNLQAKRLGPLLRRVFATQDAQEEELDAAARLVGKLPPPEAKEVAEVVLARGGWESPLLWGLPEGDFAIALATRIFKDPAFSGQSRAAAVRVATGDGSRGHSELLKAALNDPDPEVRETAGDNAARCKCSDALLRDVLAALGREIATPTTVANNEWAHTRLVDHHQFAIHGCLRDAVDASFHAQVAAAIENGLRLDPTQSTTPAIYFTVISWAEQNATATVPGLLVLAEQSCGAQKYADGPALLYRVTQWRVLRAIKAGDWKTAKAQLKLFDPKNSRVQVPVLEVADLGKLLRLYGREENVSSFIERMNGQLKK